MNLKESIAISLVAALFNGSVAVAAETRAASKPNIIIILSDDHGYTDLGIRGIDSNVQTPALDKLAANGALMQYGYSTAPQWLPSRTGLMSQAANAYYDFYLDGKSADALRQKLRATDEPEDK